MKKLLALVALAMTSQLPATEFDYDGDGKADIAVRRPGTQFWYVKNSGDPDFNSERGDGIQRVKFGLSEGDIPVPADYDGDGVTDFAVRRASNFTWYVKNSSGDNTNSEREDGIQRETFGRNADDIPVPADYDGDGIADFAVRRPSTFIWYIKNSSGTNFNSEREDGIQRIIFGKNANDIPVKGDFDGDGYADVAVFRPSNGVWYILNSSGDNTNSDREDGIQRVSFSSSERDIPVPADYDGDGVTDIAYRDPENFTWHIRSSINGEETEVEFGFHPQDIPVPADYNGDGKAELAIRRAGDQTFIIYNPDVIPGETAPTDEGNTGERASRSNNDEGDSETVSFGSQSGDIPINASTSQVIEKLEDTNENGSSDNNLPEANAGSDQTVSVGDTVTLDGTSSSDEDGDAITYTWRLRSAPDDSTASLSDTSAESPTFIADVAGNYVIALTVNDGTDDSATDRVRITAEDATTENTEPEADAGEDQTVSVGTRVELDGSGSTDADGDDLTYSWSFTSMPEGSEAQLGRSTIQSPKFTADVAGTYELELIVNDGTVDSNADSVTIFAEEETTNTTPEADAGDDQSVTVGDIVNLDGSGSSDSDGDSLTYNWSFTNRPSGSTATLSNADTVSPSFTADAEGDFVVSLTVSDGTATSSADSVTISASIDNSAPVADAGDDQSVETGETVTLDGSGSSDADGDDLTYSWSLTSIPSGSGATLSSASSDSPSFTADLDGTYVASLTVNDGTESSMADTVTITASTSNSAPDADAGEDQSVETGSTVTLDGSGSSDEDGDSLSYSWSLTSIPSGSSASLTRRVSVSPTFTADTDGTYVVSLTVNDGTEDSEADTVTITASTTVTAEPTDNEALLETSFDAARFEASADNTVAARPYVMVDFIDHDRDGNNDAALLQSNGFHYAYDYDYTTADSDNIADTCFDDPNNGPDEADSGGCYSIERNVRAFVVPVEPELADSITNISSDQHSGMAISGATFELPTAPSPEDSAGYAITNVYDEGWEVLDDCNGHSGYLGAPYHYHGDPTYPINDGTNEHTQRATEASDCLPDYELVVDEEYGHAPLIGYMADGFPIYGTDGYDVGDDLDECNGHSSSTAEYPNGTYHYHALNYDVVTANGTGSRREEPPLPECLSGKVWFVPEFHSPELSDTSFRDIDTELSVESTNTTVDGATLVQTYANYRFEATNNGEARPYVYVELIDWDFNGEADTAMLLSNGIPSTYDYDDTTSDSNDIANVCFDDPEGGPDTGCYEMDGNNRVFLFSLNPTAASNNTNVSDDDHSGMAISGGTFAHPNENSPSGVGYAVTNTYDDDWEVMDDCNGNVSYLGGPYHYHGDPTNPNRDSVDEHTATAARAAACLPNYDKEADESTGHTPVIGFMADGFPIYGEDGYDSGDALDECNGHTGATAEFPDGIYHYHALSDDTSSSEGLPPLPECLSGEILYLPNYPSPELTEAQ